MNVPCISTVAFMFLLTIALVIIPVSAQYFPPAPLEPIVVKKTLITVSYTQPQKTIIIDVTQFDPEQIVKKMTLTFTVPVSSATFEIYHLKQKPLEVPDPKETALLYFMIRAHEDLLENVEKAVITFAIEKDIIEEKRVNVDTIILKRFFKGTWQELSTKKVGKDEKFLYFEAESPGLSHFVVTGVVPLLFFPWWIIIIIVAIVIVVVLGIYLYRRK